jgi:hypothetical protein
LHFFCADCLFFTLIIFHISNDSLSVEHINLTILNLIISKQNPSSSICFNAFVIASFLCLCSKSNWYQEHSHKHSGLACAHGPFSSSSRKCWYWVSAPSNGPWNWHHGFATNWRHSQIVFKTNPPSRQLAILVIQGPRKAPGWLGPVSVSAPAPPAARSARSVTTGGRGCCCAPSLAAQNDGICPESSVVHSGS